MSNDNKQAVYVYLNRGDKESLLVGQLICDYDNKKTAFKYSARYVAHPDAFALDPINLPLQAEIHFENAMTRFTNGIPGVLTDNSPERYNRMVLREVYKDAPPITDIDFMIKGSNYGTGALEFRATRSKEKNQSPYRPFDNLEDIMEVAADIEDGLDVPKEKEIYFSRLEQSSGLGGGRPKALVEEGDKSFLVKFAARGDAANVCITEHVCMQMCAEAGVDTAPTRIMETAKGPILLVERFDFQKDNAPLHVVSFASLKNAQVDPVPDMSKVSYPNLKTVSETIASLNSEEATEVGKEVFRRMVVNIAIGNTDDHGTNHAFIKDKSGGDYKLTPAYDVVSRLGVYGGSSHAVPISQLGMSPTVEGIALAAREMNLEKHDAAEIADTVLKVTENWRERMENEGMNQKELNVVAACFKGRDRIQQYLDSIPEVQREKAKNQSQSFSVDR